MRLEETTLDTSSPTDDQRNGHTFRYIAKNDYFSLESDIGSVISL